MTTQAIGNNCAPAISPSASNPSANLRQDFKSLENALLNGDLNNAQASFASLNDSVSAAQAAARPSSVLSQLGDAGSPLGQDLQAVSTALDANDVGGAQKAFATLQHDMESARSAGDGAKVHHGHHGHHGKDTDAGSPTQASAVATESSDTSAEDLLKALQSLASANPKVANDLGTLITDLNVGKVVNTSA